MNHIEFNKLKENFKRRNIEVSYFETLHEVQQHIFEIIPSKSTVGIGHSVTLQKMDLTNLLIKRGNTVYDKELGNTKEECMRIKKKSLLTEWYITGSNAISIDGRIVNIDHSGNRVSAMSFGPDKVVIVVGKNKIVDTLDEAIKRAKNIAAPLNAKRAGYNPPCVKLNKCVDCVSDERVCNSLVIIEGQSDWSRIKLFIVNHECGF
ncbi:lactate utilization protein [Oceanirhabdus seepicola]|uniref:Lactate utilization protein n=1 Tax=Oceanirhabdus seepicola TaxID=2828781 RepID=A0A9J6P1I7_9CLOT|nr:lactate utilization protein [Oceanirhabdus seepicola]MCM1990634.1 lactate utilization protein [Oceanirhabdus seepicola]